MKIENNFHFDQSRHLLIAGNSIIADQETAFRTADFLKELAEKIDVDLIFQANYRKSIAAPEHSAEVLPLPESLDILSEIKRRFELPVLSDIYSENELNEGVSEVIDIFQIPSYLALHNGLIKAVAKTEKPINVKKPKYLSPDAMLGVCQRIKKESEDNQIFLTEIGTFFGYDDLVIDLRSLHHLKETGYPVIFDVGQMTTRYALEDINFKKPNTSLLSTIINGCAAADLNGFSVEVIVNKEYQWEQNKTRLTFKDAEHLITRFFEIAKFARILNTQ